MDLYNDSHEKVCILSGIKETCITSTLKTGDKEITFEFRKTNRYAADIKEEGYIRTDTDEFVIKQVEPSGEWYKCTGTLNVEELEGKQYPQGFETVEKTVDECLTEAIDGTGWKVIRCDVSKKRTIRIEQNCSAWDVAQQAITMYRCEMVFDSLNKGISVYEKYGEDRGAYFIERLKPYVNVKKLKKIVSKHSKRKEREKHERMERSVRNGGRTAGGVRHNSITDNGISETQYQESNERGCRRKENHRMAARGA